MFSFEVININWFWQHRKSCIKRNLSITNDYSIDIVSGIVTICFGFQLRTLDHIINYIRCLNCVCYNGLYMFNTRGDFCVYCCVSDHVEVAAGCTTHESRESNSRSKFVCIRMYHWSCHDRPWLPFINIKRKFVIQPALDRVPFSSTLNDDSCVKRAVCNGNKLNDRPLWSRRLEGFAWD